MKHKIAKKLAGLTGIVFLFFSRPVFAQIGKPEDLVPCSGFECNWCNVFGILQKVFNTAEIIFFPLIVIFIIYGAVLYIISSITGSEEGLSKAKATATDAIIGLILVLLTFVIVNATIIGIVGGPVTLQTFVSVQCDTIKTDPGLSQ